MASGWPAPNNLAIASVSSSSWLVRSWRLGGPGAASTMVSAAGASLRVFADVEATLSGDLEQLGLEPAGTDLAVPLQWFRCT